MIWSILRQKNNILSFLGLENIFLFSSASLHGVYSPLSFHSKTTSFDLFFIPICGGLLLQYMYPRSSGFSKAILKRMTPFAVLCMYFTFLKSDLDLYAHGWFAWMVSHTWLTCMFSQRIRMRITSIAEPSTRPDFGSYSISIELALVSGIEFEEWWLCDDCGRSAR